MKETELKSFKKDSEEPNKKWRCWHKRPQALKDPPQASVILGETEGERCVWRPHGGSWGAESHPSASDGGLELGMAAMVQF